MTKAHRGLGKGHWPAARPLNHYPRLEPGQRWLAPFGLWRGEDEMDGGAEATLARDGASDGGVTVAVTPFAAAFGAEVRGVEWDRVTAADVVVLTRALRRHLLLVFRGQASPTHEQLDSFFIRFGRLVSGSYDGTFHYKTFTDKDSDQVHRKGDFNYVVNTEEGQTELVWHSDHFHRPQLKILSVLEAIDLEPGVVPTQFRDMYTAFEMLPAAVRAELEFKQTVNLDPRKSDLEKWPRLADSMHPVFTPHPHSSRRAIYVNDFTHRIAGVSVEDSDRWLRVLREHSLEHAPVYTHEWRVGDICVWDNVGLQHRRDAMAPGRRRVLRQYEGVAE
jgi:taurine dioxygenase